MYTDMDLEYFFVFTQARHRAFLKHVERQALWRSELLRHRQALLRQKQAHHAPRRLLQRLRAIRDGVRMIRLVVRTHWQKRSSVPGACAHGRARSRRTGVGVSGHEV